MTYFERLEAAAHRNGSRLCVGLDPDPARIEGDVGRFLVEIIAATRDLVCCYKPNLAFFEALGDAGTAALRQALEAIPADIPVIADAKRGDIDSTAAAYARAIFEQWQFDAVTVNVYGGVDSVRPFLDYAERGVYLWCRSSNPGAADFQELLVSADDGVQRPLYEVVALRAAEWNEHGNIGLVAGATAPQPIARLRAICPTLPLLMPGVGAQGGALEAAVGAASDGDGGFIVNASRGVLYAARGDRFATAARNEAARLREAIASAQRAVGSERRDGGGQP